MGSSNACSTPMQALAEGRALVIWPDVRHRAESHIVAGYARLPNGDVWFRDGWNDPAGQTPAFLLEGHAEPVQDGIWKVGSALIRVIDQGPETTLAAMAYAHNRAVGADPSRFNEMARDLYGKRW